MYFIGVALSLILQVALIVHVFRNGKERFWIYLIFFIPVAGSVAYLLLEVLPDLRHSRAVSSTGRVISRVVNPTGKQRQLEAELAACNTVANKVALAEALLENNDYKRALELLDGARQGIYKDDPKILACLTKAYFQAQNFDQVISSYQDLLSTHPNLMSANDYLNLATAYQERARPQEAESNYQIAIGKSGSFEIKYRFAQFLMAHNQKEAAVKLLQEITRLAKAIPRHAVKLEKPWIQHAEEELTKLTGQ